MMLWMFFEITILLYIYLQNISSIQKPAYVYGEVLLKKESKIFSKDTFLFFRTNESFSNKKELKKLIGRKNNPYSEKLYANADKQEKLNNLKRVRKIKKSQRIRGLKKNIKNIFKGYKFKDFIILFIYIVLPFLFLILLMNSQIQTYFTNLKSVIVEYRVDIYLAQLSLTFITISLMSIFSDSNAIILWENIVKKTLIEPPASCFKAYFSYSFIYLLFSSISFAFKYVEGLAVFFAFNVICLFDLSRTMINCYYDPNRKKKKIIKDFIKKIEEANINVLKTGPGNVADEFINEIKSTFEDFNYYINDAFEKEKISDIKENLSVYGKLLAHIDGVVLSVEEINVMQWYCKKTHKSYIDLVKNYYEECNDILTGISNTNSQQVSASLSEIHRFIIDKLIVKLANDNKNVYIKDEVYNLILFALYINILAIARDEDEDNIDKYILEDFDGVKSSTLKYKKDRLKDMIRMLNSALKKERNIEYRMGFYLYPALARAIGGIILINTDDLLILKMDFLNWNEIEEKEKLIEKINIYVEENIKDFSEERKEKCIRRKEKVLKVLTIDN